MISKEEVYNLSLQGLSVNQIANELSCSNQTIYKHLRILDNQYLIFKNSLLREKIIDKDELDEIIKMIFDGYMLIEIAIIKNKTIDDINNILHNLNMSSSPYYNPKFYLNIKQKLNKTMKQDHNLLFKRLRNLEQKGYNLDEYPKIKILKEYEVLKKCFALIEDFLSDNYDSLQQLVLKHHLKSDMLHLIVTEKDQFNFLNNYVDSITKQKIKLQYQKRKLEVTKKVISYASDNEDKEKIYSLSNNSTFWVLFAITFKVSAFELANMLNIKDSKKVYCILFDKAKILGNRYINGYNYVNYNASLNSENLLIAKRFYQKYLLMKHINHDEAFKMLDELKDQEYYSLVKSKKTLKDMTEEERLIIAKYWVKYAMPIDNMPYSKADLNTYCRPLMALEINEIEEYNKETLIMIKKQATKNNIRRKS